MSRLDSFIRRLEAQRACLDWACDRIAGLSGVVLELGLGNGRSYDHLRERIGAGCEIYAFDRALAAHPACVPPAGRLVLGDLRRTLPGFAAGPVALAHADLGSGDVEANAALARWLGPALAPLLAPGGLILSDQALSDPRLAALALPAPVAAGRYFAFRRR
ncbi:MAG: class I SAM-dependent methyltransferase [Burkholderiales bacterium]